MIKKKSRENKVLFLLFVIIILGLALFMRFYMIDARPLHFDEGTSWLSFMNKIYQGEKLDYVPDFHGFTTYYLSSIPLFFSGVNVFSIRFMVALFGFLTVMLFFVLRKEIGNFGTIIASLFFAISPTLIFYSRQTSQYTYLVFFTMLSFVFLVLYLRKNKMIYFYLFFLTIGLSITTHEITLIFLAAIFSFAILLVNFNPSRAKIISKIIKNHKKNNYLAIIIAFLIVILVVIIIMSSFFTNFESLAGFLKQSSFQLEKSYSTGHNKSTIYYIKTFFPIEIFAFLGTILSLFLFRKNLFYLFVFYWAFFSLLVFSIIPYKVPWMFVLVLLPMYLVSGITFESLYQKFKDKKILKIILFVLIIILFLLTLYASIKLNYIYPTARSKINPLNYVGPMDDNFRLFKDLQNLGDKNMKILFVGDGLWPLHYYLKEYKNYFVAENSNLSSFYNDYDVIIIPPRKNYDDNLLKELGKYELRENYYIKILAVSKEAQNQNQLSTGLNDEGY